MLGSNKFKQSNCEGTLPFQNPLEHCPFACGCMHNDCMHCKKGYLDQQLDEAPSGLTAFNTELGKFRYTVMSFGVTVAGEDFQCKLDQCGHIKNVIVIADDIMIVGKKHNHSNHDKALTALLEAARRCNVQLNDEKLQYKRNEVNFFGETYTSGHKPV